MNRTQTRTRTPSFVGEPNPNHENLKDLNPNSENSNDPNPENLNDPNPNSENLNDPNPDNLNDPNRNPKIQTAHEFTAPTIRSRALL